MVSARERETKTQNFAQLIIVSFFDRIVMRVNQSSTKLSRSTTVDRVDKVSVMNAQARRNQFLRGVGEQSLFESVIIVF